MREGGFTVLEVVVAISIFSLVIGLSYGMFVSLEHSNVENKLYLKMMSIMQSEVLDWRNNSHLEDRELFIDQTAVIREIETFYYDTNIERAFITYRWQANKKKFKIDWQIDRFLP